MQGWGTKERLELTGGWRRGQGRYLQQLSSLLHNVRAVEENLEELVLLGVVPIEGAVQVRH